MNTQEKVLFIDTTNSQANLEHVFVLHPNKINWLSHFIPGTFDKAVIQNVPTSDLSSLGLFYIGNALKENGALEIYIHQPISVMQSLESEEVEALARLAGYADIKISDYEKWTRQGEKDIKFSTIKLQMVRPKKVLLG